MSTVASAPGMNRAAGASNLVALGAGTVLSGIFLLAEIGGTGGVDVFAGVTMAGFAAGLAMTFVSGDARFMFAEDSVTTAL